MDCCQPMVIRKVVSGEESCCEPSGVKRRFVSKKEELENLENYREQLKKELEGLDEHLQDLKQK